MDSSGVPGTQPAGDEVAETPYSVLKALGGRIQHHNGYLSKLFVRVQALEAALDKIRSDPAKIAIHEVLSAVKGLRGSKEELTRAYNAAAASAKSAVTDSVNTPSCTTTSDATTQTPCWLLYDSMPQGSNGGDNMDGGPKS